jgi:hypothetical protein
MRKVWIEAALNGPWGRETAAGNTVGSWPEGMLFRIMLWHAGLNTQVLIAAFTYQARRQT